MIVFELLYLHFVLQLLPWKDLGLVLKWVENACLGLWTCICVLHCVEMLIVLS